MAARLGAVEVADLGDAELMDVIAAYEAQAAWAAGMQLLALAEFSRRRPGGQREFAGDEVAPAAGLTRFTAEARLSLAGKACDQFTDLLDGMLTAGCGRFTHHRTTA